MPELEPVLHEARRGANGPSPLVQHDLVQRSDKRSILMSFQAREPPSTTTAATIAGELHLDQLDGGRRPPLDIAGFVGQVRHLAGRHEGGERHVEDLSA